MLNNCLKFFRYSLSRLVLFLMRWKVRSTVLPERAIYVFAPHTSYWDGFFLWVTSWCLKEKFLALLWHGVYDKAPWFFRRCGFIPVYPSGRRALRSVYQFAARNEDFRLVISPEGNRDRDIWKMSFYHLAKKFNMPIVLIAVDYCSKTITCDSCVYPSNDFKADCAQIASFYEGVVAKHPDKFANIQVG